MRNKCLIFWKQYSHDDYNYWLDTRTYGAPSLVRWGILTVPWSWQPELVGTLERVVSAAGLGARPVQEEVGRLALLLRGREPVGISWIRVKLHGRGFDEFVQKAVMRIWLGRRSVGSE